MRYNAVSIKVNVQKIEVRSPDARKARLKPKTNFVAIAENNAPKRIICFFMPTVFPYITIKKQNNITRPRTAAFVSVR